jgi:hypothetical protein
MARRTRPGISRSAAVRPLSVNQRKWPSELNSFEAFDCRHHCDQRRDRHRIRAWTLWIVVAADPSNSGFFGIWPRRLGRHSGILDARARSLGCLFGRKRFGFSLIECGNTAKQPLDFVGRCFRLAVARLSASLWPSRRLGELACLERAPLRPPAASAQKSEAMPLVSQSP